MAEPKRRKPAARQKPPGAAGLRDVGKDAAADAKRAPFRKRKTAHSTWSYEDYLVDALAQFEEMARDASTDASHVAAVSAKQRAVATRAELEQVRAAKRPPKFPTSEEEYNAEILTEHRQQRLQALQAGSFVAASQMLRAERDLVAAHFAEIRQRADDEKKKKTPEQVLAEARAAARELGLDVPELE